MNKKFILFSVLLVFILIVSMTFAVMVGSVSVTPLYVWKVILSKLPFIHNFIESDWSRSQEIIIWQIRVPRVILAAIVGAGLAIAGVAIQALVRNSIADPYILGISSGALVGATSVIILGAFSFLGMYALSVSAFLGSLFAIVLVFFIACWRACFYLSSTISRHGGVLYFNSRFEFYFNDGKARGCIKGSDVLDAW